MSESIEKRIEEIKKNCGEPKSADGFLFASIETPQMSICIGEEYIIYLQQHGPPHRGKFDHHKLNRIRRDYNITVPSI